ncbi:transglutaminase-like domain-containing protein [Amycolatopsis suaedae]|uniref:Transglutaminase domain-containing protein n=1 Tax=Amycolatopsis suaedae TaxID=2510978 RepID=A0A4Q7J0P7_9PSEU|nr:transglutaminase-like domain-containing protein [Amycolatopsis suaedae]RZQ60142.1 transglutaminase domain-containing protein [Amycolatopsis suaedae]
MTGVIDYTSPGPFTGLDGVDPVALEPAAADPVGICRPVRYLFIQPTDARPLGLPAPRFDSNQIRRVDELVRLLLALDPAPLTTAREPDRRVVGTCRHFATLGCALLRRNGITARPRAGFATYFEPGKAVDHWITEYLDGDRWVRVDVEHLGKDLPGRLHDLRPEDFLTGGEAWSAYRRGEVDGSRFGVVGTENWGPAEISGNALRDLAALNKIEPLPWDEWGRMTDAYAGKTGEDYDVLLDEVATVCAEDDPVSVRALYQHEDLRVPESLIR